MKIAPMFAAIICIPTMCAGIGLIAAMLNRMSHACHYAVIANVTAIDHVLSGRCNVHAQYVIDTGDLIIGEADDMPCAWNVTSIVNGCYNRRSPDVLRLGVDAVRFSDVKEEDNLLAVGICLFVAGIIPLFFACIVMIVDMNHEARARARARSGGGSDALEITRVCDSASEM